MFVGAPQPKPMRGFLPNFQDIFTPIESKADYRLRGYLATIVVLTTLLRFLGLVSQRILNLAQFLAQSGT